MKLVTNRLFRFFNNSSIKQAIKFLYPNTWRALYVRLHMLFRTTKDPTMPRGRKYISTAVKDSSKWFHNHIMDEIDAVFSGRGQWIEGNPYGGYR